MEIAEGTATTIILVRILSEKTCSITGVEL